MSDTYELVGSIRESTRTIRTYWPDMLTPTGSGGIAKAPSGTVTLADDHSDTDNDTPRLERLLSLRREVTEALNSWARIIIEERHITATAPGGLNTLALAAFIDTHAEWLSGHEAGEDAADELKTWAVKVRRASGEPLYGDKSELIVQTVNAGRCPITIGAEEIPCATTIRLPILHDTDTAVTCRGCGTEDTVNGWVLRIVGEQALVTADELIPILHRAMGMRVTTVAIRQWVARDVIRSEGKDDTGRNLYDRHAVMHALRHREPQRARI